MQLKWAIFTWRWVHDSFLLLFSVYGIRYTESFHYVKGDSAIIMMMCWPFKCFWG